MRRFRSWTGLCGSVGYKCEIHMRVVLVLVESQNAPRQQAPHRNRSAVRPRSASASRVGARPQRSLDRFRVLADVFGFHELFALTSTFIFMIVDKFANFWRLIFCTCSSNSVSRRNFSPFACVSLFLDRTSSSLMILARACHAAGHALAASGDRRGRRGR